MRRVTARSALECAGSACAFKAAAEPPQSKAFGLLLLVLLAFSCKSRYEKSEVQSIGDVNHGKQLIQQYGCQSCHTIPGVTGPKGVVGPPLDKMAERGFIGGKVQNTPQNMTAWLQNPQAFDPGNAMPNLGVTPKDAQDITAYLFTLK